MAPFGWQHKDAIAKKTQPVFNHLLSAITVYIRLHTDKGLIILYQLDIKITFKSCFVEFVSTDGLYGLMCCVFNDVG